MTPCEIIARHLCTMAAQGWSGISPFERAAYRTTAAGMVEVITAAGFRIVGPDEAREADLRDFVEGIEDPVLRRFAEDKLSRALKEKQE